MKIIKLLVVLTLTLGVSVGTASAAQDPFLVEEDFSGTPGDGLSTKTQWTLDSRPSIEFNSTVIDEGNSGDVSPYTPYFWKPDYYGYIYDDPEKTVAPIEMDAGQAFVVIGYLQFSDWWWETRSGRNPDWFRFGLGNRVYSGPSIEIEVTGDGTQDIHVYGGGDFDQDKSSGHEETCRTTTSVALPLDTLIGLCVVQTAGAGFWGDVWTESPFDPDLTQGYYNVDGGAWIELTPSVAGWNK